ncbi:MAG: hypothetical protein KatS3mg115_1320 [Candidatus Poribacteria bacterium]|nr:MAG: hypothetical protein KatS3mg115_1320 [Candidatus Poribacteria bacterium]
MKWLFFLVILLIGTLWSRRSAQAYAEWHYRFLPGLSLLFRRRPEIYWDAPWRVEHGQPLPLAVLVKDADRFPVRIESVQFRLLRSGGKKIKGETERLWKEEIEAFFPRSENASRAVLLPDLLASAAGGATGRTHLHPGGL